MNRDTRRTRVLLALLLITSIALITIDYRGGDSSPLDGVRSAAAAVFGPVERVAAAIASPVSDAADSVGRTRS
jgi:rod shape-determining protein MreC